MNVTDTIHTQQELNLMDIPIQTQADSGQALDPTPTPKEEVKPEVKPEPKPEPKPEWDKARQFQDELRAANRRLAARETELAELRAFKDKVDSEQRKLPEDASVEEVIGKVNELQQTISAKEREIASLKEDREQVVSQSDETAKEAARAEGAQALNSLFDRMNQEYGPQHANPAREQLEQAWAKSVYCQTNGDGEFVYPAEIRQEFVKTTLEKIYLNLSKSGPVRTAKAAEHAPAVPAVTGSGASQPGGELPEPGQNATKDEVRAWLAKKYTKK